MDVVNGGRGDDGLRFWDVGDEDRGNGMVIDLNKACQFRNDGQDNIEKVAGIERFGGRMTGDSAENDFQGIDGNDTLIGGNRGNDVLTGGDGPDDFYFGDNLGQGGVNLISDKQAGTDKIWMGAG